VRFTFSEFVIKKLWLVLLFSFLFVPHVFAEEGGCPGEEAAEKGFDPIKEFHHAIAPVWHKAYPAKDFDAMMAAAPEFEKALEGVMKLEPKFTDAEKAKAFTDSRDALAAVVANYSKAVAAPDQDLVYELLPKVHEQFEATASAILASDG